MNRFDPKLIRAMSTFKSLKTYLKFGNKSESEPVIIDPTSSSSSAWWPNDRKDNMKIKEIARISPMGRDSNGNTQPAITSITYKTVAELGASAPLRRLALAAVYEYKEPLSVVEITAHINNTLGTDFNEALVRYNLDCLLKEGDVLMRQEQPQERMLRANGVKPTMNKLAQLFFRRDIGIPYRSTVELVPGVILKGPSSPRAPKSTSTKAFNPKATAEQVLGTPRPSSENAALDFLIEKLVAERTAEIQKKLDDANAKLAEFKKLLS
jgi:hypothetical protein